MSLKDSGQPQTSSGPFCSECSVGALSERYNGINSSQVAGGGQTLSTQSDSFNMINC